MLDGGVMVIKVRECSCVYEAGYGNQLGARPACHFIGYIGQVRMVYNPCNNKQITPSYYKHISDTLCA